MCPGPGFAILARGCLTLMLSQPGAGAGRAGQAGFGSEPPATS